MASLFILGVISERKLERITMTVHPEGGGFATVTDEEIEQAQEACIYAHKIVSDLDGPAKCSKNTDRLHKQLSHFRVKFAVWFY